MTELFLSWEVLAAVWLLCGIGAICLNTGGRDGRDMLGWILALILGPVALGAVIVERVE